MLEGDTALSRVLYTDVSLALNLLVLVYIFAVAMAMSIPELTLSYLDAGSLTTAYEPFQI